MGIQVIQVAVRGFDENFSYVLYEEDSKHGIIVDPSGSIEKVFKEVDRHGIEVVAIFLTHSHFDHVDKLRDALDRYYVPIVVHESSAEQFRRDGEVRPVGEGDVFMLGECRITVMHTPGHISDSLCYYIDERESADGLPKLIAGDTVFVEGCGRTNEHDVRDLYESIQRIKELPERTLVYPGHDYGSVPHSTLRHEHAANKYFKAENFEEFKKLRLEL